MASTSASSVEKSFKYDVFLSFRGEDTRKTFVDHLYHALHQKGIVTYKDDVRIQKGERISDQLIRSIEESRFYIIVFSKNYASSSWCLDELVKIMECRKMPGHTAFPIFYDVEPTEVRHQRGAVGEAFAKHENGSWSSALPLGRLCSIVASCCQGSSSSLTGFTADDLENGDDVGRWRNALKEAADLAGMELKNTSNGHEAKFIEDIITKEISPKLYFINSISSDEDLVGMEFRVNKIVSSLQIGIESVRVIGIKGMGGAGKTTLARAVFDHIPIDQFEGKSFVENVRENSKGSGLKELQKQILSNVLNDQSIVVTGVSDGKNMMKRLMRGKKVLVVLDDVDNIEQLEALCKPNWFKPGSRIIITTRDDQVLKAHRANFIHDVSLLSDKEAICLFSRHAFKGDIPNQGYGELSGKVVQYAAGLPLTIKVLGSHLYGRTKREWEDAINRLNKIPLKETLEKLELSYIGLENDQKEIFLDVVCILKYVMKDDAIRRLESCGFNAEIGLRVLEQKSLITISDTYDLRFHDHIEEMGWNIVRRLHPNEPSKHSRLWIREEIKDILVNESGTEETNCIRLMSPRLHPVIIMKGLRKMKKLRLLHLEPAYEIDEGYEYHTDKHDEVSQYLPDALQSLYWPRYPFFCLPKTFQANNLVYLGMRGSDISQLWDGGEQKVLNKLKFLDLYNSKLRTFDLTMTPLIKELNLGECDDLVKFHLPVRCMNLKSLTLRVSKEGKLDLGLTPLLEKLDLHACNEFELHMPVECLMLKDLRLEGCKVSNLNLELTPHLEILRLIDCYCLQKIHAPVGCLKKVAECWLENCANFERFQLYKVHESGDLDSVATFEIEALSVDICPLHPENFLPGFWLSCHNDEPGSSWSGNLEKIISAPCACKTFEYLFETICSLQRLRMLSLQGSIPGDPWQLESLEKLSLWYLRINHLPDSICMLRHLKYLEIGYCEGIEQLPGNISRLECLEELFISYCPSLREIPKNICNMKCLKRLHLRECHLVEKLPDELGCLECLEELHLDLCTSLREIPNGICKLKCLKRLHLSGCNQVEKLPEELGCLECLEELVLNSCTSLREIPNNICKLTCLKCLDLSRCNQVLPEELGCLECLEELLLNSCTISREILNSICKLKCLKYLDLSGCHQIEKLPEELECLECLEELHLKSCTSLREMPNIICKLKRLKVLNLRECNQVEKLPEEIGCLECLKELFVEGAGIRRLPQSIYQLEGLSITGSREQLESYGFPPFTIMMDDMMLILGKGVNKKRQDRQCQDEYPS